MSRLICNVHHLTRVDLWAVWTGSHINVTFESHVVHHWAVAYCRNVTSHGCAQWVLVSCNKSMWEILACNKMASRVCHLSWLLERCMPISMRLTFCPCQEKLGRLNTGCQQLPHWDLRSLPRIASAPVALLGLMSLSNFSTPFLYNM